jgi:hypothetical protein
MTITTINNWRDLEQFGIRSLTAESCNYSMRMLCDLTEQGKQIVADYFGLVLQDPLGHTLHSLIKAKSNNPQMKVKDLELPEVQFTSFPENRNSRAIASCYISHAMLNDIGVFCLLSQEEIYAAAIHEHQIRGYTEEEYFEIRAKDYCSRVRFYTKYKKHPHSGSRNIHAFTGNIG